MGDVLFLHGQELVLGYTVETEAEEFEGLGLRQKHQQAVQTPDQVLIVLHIQ